MNDKNLRLLANLLLATGVFTSASVAHAAGGHHAVDDAAILEPGQCQVETWADRERSAARTLQHLGSACRLGAVEAGLNLDRAHVSGTDPVITAAPQIKWAGALGQRVSAGLVVSANWQDRSAGYVGSTVVLPLTWQASDTLQVHVNAGRDFRAHAADDSRAGIALEWAPLPAWSVVAERFHENRTNFWRAGARWVLRPTLNIDLSRARSLDGSVPSWWTLGLTWMFER